MVRELNEFDQLAVGRQAAEAEAGLLEALAVGVVEFVAVTMPLADNKSAQIREFVIDRTGGGA